MGPILLHHSSGWGRGPNLPSTGSLSEACRQPCNTNCSRYNWKVVLSYLGLKVSEWVCQTVKQHTVLATPTGGVGYSNLALPVLLRPRGKRNLHLIVCRRLLRVPWTAWRSNQSVLNEINSEYSLEGLVLKLKLQYFGHPMLRADSLEKTLVLGRIEGKRKRGCQRKRWLDGIIDSMNMHLKIVEDRGAWWATQGCKESDMT